MTKLIFHGHSFVEIEHNHRSFLIDPFIEGNTLCDTTIEDVKLLGIEAIVVTHGHADHVGDTVSIAKKVGCPVVGEFQLMKYLANEEWVKNIVPMNVGGHIQIGDAIIKLFPAIHGGGIGGEKPYKYNGLATGVMFTIGGKKIYHAGDTGLTKDFEILGAYEHVDYAFLPIGDRFTMGPRDAVIAAQMMKAQQMIPIHYNTRDIIHVDTNYFLQLTQQAWVSANVLPAGGYIEY